MTMNDRDDAAAHAAARLVETATKVDEAWDVRTNAYDVTSYVAKTTLDEMYQRLKAMRSALDALAALPAHPPAPLPLDVLRATLDELQVYTCEDGLAMYEVRDVLDAYALVKRGEWPSVRVGNVIRIPRLALDAWIERQMEKGA